MAETTVVADRSRRAKGWVGIVFGAIFGGFGTAFLVGVTLAATAAPSPLLVFLLGMGGIFAVGGLVQARFQRVGGARRAQQAPRLTAELVGQERVTYRQGTDDHTVTQEICRRELAVSSDQIPGTVSGQVAIQVPH